MWRADITKPVKRFQSRSSPPVRRRGCTKSEILFSTDFNHPPPLLWWFVIVVTLTKSQPKFTGTVINFTGAVITFAVNARKVQALSCMYLCNLLMSTVMLQQLPVKKMTAPVNFGQLLELTFTKVNLAITRGGSTGWVATKSVTLTQGSIN